LTEAAPTLQKCVKNVCYSLSIPNTTATSGKGDIFFQISAPTSFSWVALGQGSSMAGSNIFVIYSSADGKNVTLSPRTTSGHTQPASDSAAQATLLAGSGISNGNMIANVRCRNCDSWNGGVMDFTDTTSQWIYAMASGNMLNSDDVNIGIKQHAGSAAASFSWDISAAKGGSDVNPFLVQDSSISTPTTSVNTTSSTASAGDDSPSSSSGGDDASNTDNEEADDSGTYDRAVTAHAVLATFAFVALFPMGGILIRVVNFNGVVRAHAALQFLGYVTYTAAFALGIWMVYTSQPDEHSHPYLGGLVFLLLLMQPLLGWLHHRRYAATGGTSGRTKMTWAHISLGRVAIFLGILNGGIGLHLSGIGGGPAIAYGVIAVLVLIAYIASIIIGERRRQHRLRRERTVIDHSPRPINLHVLDAQGNKGG
jgi:hypothetical protein